MTGYADLDLLRNGADLQVLQKPFNAAELDAQVQMLIERRRVMRALFSLRRSPPRTALLPQQQLHVLRGMIMKSMLRMHRAQAPLAAMLSGYLWFALRTTRWTLEGQPHFRPFGSGAPAVFAFWHEFLPLMPALSLIARRLPFYRPVPIHTLVSQHRDGRFIGAVVRRFGIQPVLGSSSRGGAAGLRNLLAVLRRGEMIGITPDGPKGPPREAAFGVAQLAALSGVPVVPLAARTNRRIRLNTWDRMPVPLPFGRGVVVCGPAISVPRHGWEAALPAIAEALNLAASRAETLCLA